MVRVSIERLLDELDRQVVFDEHDRFSVSFNDSISEGTRRKGERVLELCREFKKGELK